LSAALAFGLASAANAATSPAPVAGGDAEIVKVAEGCGADHWRDASGHRHCSTPAAAASAAPISPARPACT
jgi:hypothetical protein